ncbi:MAG: SHOCT domain-containing protein [Rhodoferax sp.]|uniref:SHOCT domain-containing protein n=1 Tax=Rhodoferax sp. TaxID=50421 RepID=UPI0014008623|nr:SHOCT domain-containing protein [Rhodoferax sp.]NDP37378.1 SHOCT domain-containing protein [Rhodoferax sp.]
MKKCLASVAILLAGCANPGVVQLSPDTYILSREDHAGIFGSSSSLKAGVIADANAFAASHGKVAIPISVHEKPVGNTPGSWAKFDYQFRVLDKNDPEVRRTSLVQRADVVIEKTEKISADVRTKEQTSKPKDTYSELIKLDDLREKGILSETEFAAQKQRLLNSSD